MFKFPLVIVYAVVAFNFTAFTMLLQMDWLFFHAPMEKIIAWSVTITAWIVAYLNRNKFYTIHFK